MPGLNDPIFCSKANCADRDPSVPCQDRAAARQWLEPVSRSFVGMRSLRSVIAAHGSGRDSFRLSNPDVLNEVAQLLAAGRIHVHAPQVRRSGGSAPAAGPASNNVPFPAKDSRPRSTAFPSQTSSADPDTFGSPVDGSAQAAALAAAASDGKPFCPE